MSWLEGPECRECGCSDLDACHDEWGEPCGWAVPDDEGEPLCTLCAEGTPALGPRDRELAAEIEAFGRAAEGSG